MQIAFTSLTCPYVLFRHRVEQEHVLRLKSPVIRYRSYWTHRVWLGDPKLLQDIFQAEREGLVEKPEFPPFHRVCFSWCAWCAVSN